MSRQDERITMYGWNRVPDTRDVMPLSIAPPSAADHARQVARVKASLKARPTRPLPARTDHDMRMRAAGIHH